LPKDNGGMNISSYSLEVCENSNGGKATQTLKDFILK
jgi:hypothetical protein